MEYEKQIRYNDRQMQRYQAYLSKVQKIKRLDKRTKEMTIGDVIKKSILPLAFMVFWFWMTKTIMKVSGQTDWFWWVFIAGLPFGIHKCTVDSNSGNGYHNNTWDSCIKCHYWSIDWKHHDSGVCDQSDIVFIRYVIGK